MEIKQLYKLYQEHPYITTDSRDCPEGSIFLALKGDKFDGNQFALRALEQGCAYAIVDDPQISQQAATDKRLIPGADTLQTFKALAREHRRQFFRAKFLPSLRKANRLPKKARPRLRF